METVHHLESISKLRERLIRLIKLGEPNQGRSSTQTNDDLTVNVEECVRHLFNTSYTIETFVQNVQQILNVTIKHSLTLFLVETIPLAHQYLQQNQYDPYSWEIFKSIPLQTSSSSNVISNSSDSTRLPSLQQAHFRLPPSCPQLIDLTSSCQKDLVPYIRPDANIYQQKLINRFARKNFHLSQCGEHVFLQTLYAFLTYIIRRLHFFAQHRLDTRLFNSNIYEMTSNVREQIRFLVELNKAQTGESNRNLNIDRFHQRQVELTTNVHNGEQKCIQTPRDHRLSLLEDLRQREADETACLVLRESRLKRQKTTDNEQKIKPIRIVRGNTQDLIVVMENESILRRSKTLLYAYANR
ncbi:hypothetical protein I4U23_003143 [Adineta vaga]|nr:hypothetical protein I4U23_003143 [Adineta vaga]